jgi:hypothetical protein
LISFFLSIKVIKKLFTQNNMLTQPLRFMKPKQKVFGILSRQGAQIHLIKSYSTMEQTLKSKPPLASSPKIKDSTFVGLSGGQIFHEMMLRHNVKVVFGYPGGAILPVYDAIYNSDYFDFVLPRHEQGAGHSKSSSFSLYTHIYIYIYKYRTILMKIK